jgi:multidrug efflux system membrane fusion protein
MKLDAPEARPIVKPSPVSQPESVLPVHVEKKKSRWWVWVLVLLVLGGVGYWIDRRFFQKASTTTASAAAAAARGIPVVTGVASVGDLPIYLDGLGTVTSLNTVTIRTRVDGQIEKVAYTEGQLVKAGDLLVQLDPRPFQVQLEQAQGQFAKDQAAYDVARKNVERDRMAKDAIAAQQLDTDTSSMEQAAGSIKVDQGQIDSAQLQLTYCRVTSPITGRIGLRLVDEGNIVHATDTTGLAIITQIQPISVVFSLSETDIRDVLKKIHAGAPLAVDAYDSDRTTKLASGSLLATDSQIDPTSGSLRFKATFPNTDDSLFPNQFVNARLLVDTLRHVVLAPKEAVQLSPSSTYVYVVKKVDADPKTDSAGKADSTVKPDYVVEMRNIVAGSTEGDYTAITSGLTAGEVVVVDGVDKLQDQSKVTPRRAAAKNQPTTRASSGGRTRTHTKPAAGDQPQ